MLGVSTVKYRRGTWVPYPNSAQEAFMNARRSGKTNLVINTFYGHPVSDLWMACDDEWSWPGNDFGGPLDDLDEDIE